MIQLVWAAARPAENDSQKSGSFMSTGVVAMRCGSKPRIDDPQATVAAVAEAQIELERQGLVTGRAMAQEKRPTRSSARSPKTTFKPCKWR